MNGGLGDSDIITLRELPTPLRNGCIDDSFGESGPPMKLMEKYGLTKITLYLQLKK